MYWPYQKAIVVSYQVSGHDITDYH